MVCLVCCACLRASQTCISMCRLLGALWPSAYVFDPSSLVWRVWGMWRASSFLEKLLIEKRDQEDCGDLVVSLCGKSKCPQKRFDYREAILLVNASTKWSRIGFVLTELRDKSRIKSCFLSSLFKFSHFIFQLVCIYFLE